MTVGQHCNRINRIGGPSCPACQLIRRVDAAQPHIGFESCRGCVSAASYDAGELRDSAEHTVMEFIRNLDAPERV